MVDRLPPLTALRAFDAAARHMSFARAADELNVTPAALSFQIKSLEEHLGEPLFRRLNRAVELTEAGRVLAPGAQDGFARLSAAWQAARKLTDTQTITVTAGPALTAKWLAPRIFAFATAHPEIELRFSASLRIMDFDRDGIDVAIRFGQTQDDGLFSMPIIREWVTPMMSPELAARFPTPADLRGATLLHQDDTAFLNPPIEFQAWFNAAGIGPAPRTGPRFSQADHALDAAMAGAGVVMGRISLAAEALRAGQLVMPFPLSLTTDAHYRFVCPEGAETRPQVAAFREWIVEEARGILPFDEGRTFVSAKDVAAMA
ncbi:MAG: transcriptional regulator GcvA [Pseudomonadota bacterium]